MRVLLIALLALAGCKDATMAQYRSLGSKHKVTVLSMTGQEVKVFHSTGNVSESSETHAWYFEDADTHKLVEISGGQIIVEQE
jgi:hypothetical protein